MWSASRSRLLSLAVAALAIGLAPAAGRAERKKPPPAQSHSAPALQPTQAPPPPPPVVFRQEPEVILIPKTRVYYVPDLKYGLFRYGRHWYINSGGVWYRARAYGGPYTHLADEHVPSTILRLPEKYHRQPIGRAGKSGGRD